VSTHHTARDHAHEDSGHGHSDRFYWMVALVLAVVTALEVTLFVVNEGGMIAKWIEIVILLVLSTIKGAAVVMYFMHLKGDAKIFQFVFIVPFSLAVTLLLLFLGLFGTYEGIAG
jgi:cytochrome c oxidase subunit 4/cytochrome o ubiquinol oxidase operon protein cyoD